MKNFYSIGDLRVTIDGDISNPYFLSLREYFKEKESKESNVPDLNIIVKDENESDLFFLPEGFSLSGGIAFNQEWYRVRKDTFSYAVKNLFNENEITELVLIPKSSRKLNIKRTLSYALSTEIGENNRYSRFVSSIANYSCLWYLFAMTFMKKHSLFVHCGLMAKEGKGILLTGTGGCGKTSTMMELITNSGYSFMAEDFGILREDGMLFDMQKKAAIYQTDVRWGNKYLNDAVLNLKGFEKLNWKIKILLGSNPHHYFKPVEIFGDNITHKAFLEEAFVIKRIPIDNDIECTKISSLSFAERMKSA